MIVEGYIGKFIYLFHSCMLESNTDIVIYVKMADTRILKIVFLLCRGMLKLSLVLSLVVECLLGFDFDFSIFLT